MSLSNNVYRQVSANLIILFCLISIEYVIILFNFSILRTIKHAHEL